MQCDAINNSNGESILKHLGPPLLSHEQEYVATMSSKLETGLYIISHLASDNRFHNSAIDGDGQIAIVGA